MPDPNEPLPDGGQVFTGQLIGTLEPVTLPALDGSNYSSAQRAASNAVRLLLGATGDLVDFHIISRDGPNAPLLRSRWRVQAVAGGPALRPYTTNPYPTTVNYNLRIWPHGERLQVVFDETEWTYRGQMAAIVPALLLRQLWATVPGTVASNGARVLTIGSLGTARFTPQQVQFTALNNDQVSETVPYDFTTDPEGNLVGSYGFAWSQNQERIPGLWLVTEGSTPYARKISYVVNTTDLTWHDRWDDPDEPAPPFTPLDWPSEVQAQALAAAASTWSALTDTDVDRDADVDME